MEPLSEQRLAGSHPAVIARANQASDALAVQGIYYRVVEALRSYADSDADYAKGRTAPGPVDTNARGGWSQHNHGFAIDCVPFIVGTGGAVDWNVNDAHFKAMIAALTAAGLPLRGGCKGDNDHFELAEIPAVPTNADRAAYKQGGLEAVWAQYNIPLHFNAPTS
jgi:peptidoglycan L-alanyl-D-glutamate endopeptidase CwlK